MEGKKTTDFVHSLAILFFYFHTVLFCCWLLLSTTEPTERSKTHLNRINFPLRKMHISDSQKVITKLQNPVQAIVFAGKSVVFICQRFACRCFLSHPKKYVFHLLVLSGICRFFFNFFIIFFFRFTFWMNYSKVFASSVSHWFQINYFFFFSFLNLKFTLSTRTFASRVHTLQHHIAR